MSQSSVTESESSTDDSYTTTLVQAPTAEDFASSATAQATCELPWSTSEAESGNTLGSIDRILALYCDYQGVLKV